MAARTSSVLIKQATLLWILSCFYGTLLTENAQARKINVVLFGATGDLANRYLWKGFYNLFSSELSMKFQFYGAARVDDDKGIVILNDILKNSIKCSSEECNKKKIEFIALCKYHRLKDPSDYESLQNILDMDRANDKEIGRIFYLSVPPFAYEAISKNIAEKLRPKSGETWVRVILEKPFGSDLASAKDLAHRLSVYWKDDEIYRIDHYLGKAGVQQITQFRKENPEFFDRFWNSDYVDQITIFAKEKLDAKGRMEFYDEYGVIRDVFQNHLTEIVALLAMENPDSEKPSRTSTKSSLLQNIKPVSIHDTVLGQYDVYNTQLNHELPHLTADSNTATFAAVVMEIRNKRWSNVPFVLVAGKQLDARHTFVQVKFKPRKFCVGFNLGHCTKCCEQEQIMFYIQGDLASSPLTILSDTILNITFSKNWQNVTMESNVSALFKGGNIIMKPVNSQQDAYTALIHEVFWGNREKFVSLEDLLASWTVWSPLLEALPSVRPRSYSQESLESLDFELVNGKIEYARKISDNCEVKGKSKYMMFDPQSQSFRGSKLVSGDGTTVVKQLVEDILIAARKKAQSGGIFHLGLSGGTTALRFFQMLAFMNYFPWENVHIWQVDERCVGLNNKLSNFNGICENLLKYSAVPFINIHPMPVDIAGVHCKPDDFGDKLYERYLRYHLRNGSLDFVVLGVGNDGHTASLFPNAVELQSSKWIEITKASTSNSRMTMTLGLLNKSLKIAVLILGRHKQEVVKELSHSSSKTDDLPITLIQPVSGMMTWYIDHEALSKS